MSLAFDRHLAGIGACEDARAWALYRTSSQAWKDCWWAPWLLWWAARTPVNSKQAIVRYAIKWHALSAGDPLGMGDKVVPEFDPAKLLERIERQANRLQAEAILDASTGPAAADRWDRYMQDVDALWSAAALDMWVLALRTLGPDYCTQIRAAFRQPWREML